MNKETFRKKVEKAAVLAGQIIDKSFPDALYEEIKTENEKDILMALKDIAYSTDKLSLGNVMKYLSHHKSHRIERESIAFKETEKREIEAFMLNREMPDEVRTFLKGLKKEA